MGRCQRVGRASWGALPGARESRGIHTGTPSPPPYCNGQGRIYGDPMTYDTLMDVTGGNVTFLEGGLYVFDYESPYYAPPVRGRTCRPLPAAVESRRGTAATRGPCAHRVALSPSCTAASYATGPSPLLVAAPRPPPRLLRRPPGPGAGQRQRACPPHGRPVHLRPVFQNLHLCRGQLPPCTGVPSVPTGVPDHGDPGGGTGGPAAHGG